jgi:hypothetical protein
LEVDVRCNWFDGRPRVIRFGRDELPVLAVTRVRRESAAYRPAVGPRTCFEVLTRTGRYALVYLHRDRRWLVEGVEPVGSAISMVGRTHEGFAHAA